MDMSRARVRLMVLDPPVTVAVRRDAVRHWPRCCTARTGRRATSRVSYGARYGFGCRRTHRRTTIRALPDEPALDGDAGRRHRMPSDEGRGRPEHT
jgi:hypothetical protein